MLLLCKKCVKRREGRRSAGESHQHVTPARQRAFETQIALVGMAEVLDPPSERHVIWEAVEEIERLAELYPLR